MTMINVWAKPCEACGYDVARVKACGGGWQVICDEDSGGCGSAGPVASNHAQAIDRWNYTPSPGAVALTAAAAKRLGGGV